jgi:hypothetical protein
MCFSAAGSFGMSGVLTVVGGAALARSAGRPQRMLAAIPLIFAAQQAAEGIVWTTMDVGADTTLHRAAVNTFLGIALVLWPLWLPIALRRMEQDPLRRRALTGLCWLGAVVSATALFLLLCWQPTATVTGHSIRYDYAGSTNAVQSFINLAAYVIAAVGPFFASSARMTRTIGFTFAASLVIVYTVQREVLVSVWCFFAAVLSGLILLAVAGVQPESTPSQVA